MRIHDLCTNKHRLLLGIDLEGGREMGGGHGGKEKETEGGGGEERHTQRASNYSQLVASSVGKCEASLVCAAVTVRLMRRAIAPSTHVWGANKLIRAVYSLLEMYHCGPAISSFESVWPVESEGGRMWCERLRA